MTRARTAMLVLATAVVAFRAAGAQAGRQSDTVRVGDRVVLSVVGEAQLTDTFTVGPGPAVTLPVVGSVLLHGVARDSVAHALTLAIAKFYRDPVVRAGVLMRVGVLGEVTRPGFYSLRPDMLIPDALMAAGGPTQGARVDGLEVMRNGVVFLSSDSARAALAKGLTLSQIGVSPEDQFVVPRLADPQRTFQIVTTVISISLAVVTVLLLRR